MDVEQLLHPENLTNPELIHILTSLNVPVSAENSRNDLLSVFKKVAMPLPQRGLRCMNHECNISDSEKVDCLDKPEISNLLKREPTQGINHIVNNTKKMKLSGGSHVTSPHGCANWDIPQRNAGTVYINRENLKRKISVGPLPEKMKQMKLMSE